MTVSHEAIDGFMAPMVMPFVAMNRSELDGVEPGDRIGFASRRRRSAHGSTGSRSFRQDCLPRRKEARAVRTRFEPRLGRDLVLLTVTFDPQYDDAAALSAYVRRYGADGPGWDFLTGTKADIARVCALFGVEFWPEEGLITHALRTAVIDREGRRAATLEGKGYSAAQLGDLIERLLLR